MLGCWGHVAMLQQPANKTTGYKNALSAHQCAEIGALHKIKGHWQAGAGSGLEGLRSDALYMVAQASAPIPNVLNDTKVLVRIDANIVE